MATFVSKQNGTLTDATAFYQTTSVPSLVSNSNNVISASASPSAVFTAPNTTNACIGCIIYVVTPFTSGTFALTLQESTVNTAAAVTFTTSSGLTAGQYYYVQFATPYVFTTTTAGAYRFNITRPTGASTLTLSNDGSSTTFWALPVDNRTGAPASADNLFVIAPNNTGTITTTISGTSNPNLGAVSNSTGQLNNRANNAITVGFGGALVADTTVTSSLTAVRGNVTVDTGGTLSFGTSVTPVPIANPFTLSFNETGDVNFGCIFNTGSTPTMYGAGYTGMTTTFVSGLGTAVSPLITAGDIGNVGDRIAIGATSNNATNYTESEARYIITKNSTTSYVLSNTSGGTELALANTHTSANIVNLSGSVTIDSTTANGFYILNNSTAGVFRYVTFNRCGGGQGSREGLRLDLGGTVTLDNCAANNTLGRGFDLAGSTASTHTFLCGYNIGGSGFSSAMTGLFLRCSNKTFTDLTFVLASSGGVYLSSAFNNSLTRVVCNATNTGAVTTNLYAGITILTSSNNQFASVTLRSNRNRGLAIQSGTDNTFTNSAFGDVGNNTVDINNTVSTYNQALFTNCLFGSTTLINNTTSCLFGSLWRFQNYNQTANNHRWYDQTGSGFSTGASLPDTTVYTPGSLGLRLDPNSSTGQVWKFNIPAPTGIINFFGFFQRITTANVTKVELFLPGNDPNSGTADASYTLSAALGTWEPVSISANYTGAVPLLATIKVTAIGTTGSVYVDTLYNADTTQKLTGLDIWNNGQPATLILPTAVSAADIWTFSTTGLTAPNTTGLKLVQGSTKGDLAALD